MRGAATSMNLRSMDLAFNQSILESEILHWFQMRARQSELVLTITILDEIDDIINLIYKGR